MLETLTFELHSFSPVISNIIIFDLRFYYHKKIPDFFKDNISFFDHLKNIIGITPIYPNINDDLIKLIESLTDEKKRQLLDKYKSNVIYLLKDKINDKLKTIVEFENRILKIDKDYSLINAIDDVKTLGMLE
jgi:hypothetical protein